MELVIFAGGLSSRFGKLKQLEPVDKNGNFIIDYSIRDAVQCGFNKVVIVIKKENYFLFKNSIGKRIENVIDVEYVFQNDEKYIPPQIPKSRTLPLGTGHALYCVKNIVKSPFVVINADDLYGLQAFQDASNFIKNNNDKKTLGIVCYKLSKTIYGNKPFNRGICFEDEHNTLTQIIECSVTKHNKKYIATNKKNNQIFEIQPTQNVSMNMFVFYPKIFKYLEDDFKKFLQQSDTNFLASEYELPSFVTSLIDSKKFLIKIINTNSNWFGLTYFEDKKHLQQYLEKQKK